METLLRSFCGEPVRRPDLHGGQVGPRDLLLLVQQRTPDLKTYKVLYCERGEINGKKKLYSVYRNSIICLTCQMFDGGGEAPHVPAPLPPPS